MGFLPSIVDEGMMHPDRFATDLALAAGKAITVAECCEDDGSEAQNLLALVWERAQQGRIWKVDFKDGKLAPAK